MKIFKYRNRGEIHFVTSRASECLADFDHGYDNDCRARIVEILAIDHDESYCSVEVVFANEAGLPPLPQYKSASFQEAALWLASRSGYPQVQNTSKTCYMQYNSACQLLVNQSAPTYNHIAQTWLIPV